MAQLTDAAVARLKIPPGKIVFDAQLQGFGVRGVFPDGRKSWVVQKRLGSQHVRKVIGDTAVMPAKQARAEAQALLGAIGKGEDPRTEELRKPGTVLELANEYLAVGERKGGKLSPRTKVELRRYLLKYWKPLHRLQLVEVTRRTITQQARAIAKDKGGVTGNRAFVALSAMLSWGAREGWLDANPAINANLPFGEEKARDRVLSPDELAAIWRAAGDESLGLFGPIARLLLALPLRRSEIGGWRGRRGRPRPAPDQAAGGALQEPATAHHSDQRAGRAGAADGADPRRRYPVRRHPRRPDRVPRRRQPGAHA